MKQPELGRRIADLRQSQGLTQEELVEKCNINVRTIQRIEAGEVTPRNYTIKAIFEVLGASIDDLQVSAPSEIEMPKKTWLMIAMASGVLYLFSGIPEGMMDYARFAEDLFSADLFNRSVPGSTDSNSLYILVKLLSMGSYIGLLSGFFHVSRCYRLSFLSIGTISLSLLTMAFAAFDILSLYSGTIDYSDPAVLLLYLMLFGVGGTLFGIGILSMRTKLGDVALFAGIVELMIALCLFTFFLAVVAIPLSFLAVMVELVLIYRLYKMAL